MRRSKAAGSGFYGSCNGVQGPKNYLVDRADGLLVSLNKGGSLYILAKNKDKFRLYHYIGNSAYMIGDATLDQLRPDRDGFIRCGLRRFKIHDNSHAPLARFLPN